MERHFDEELTILKERLLFMGGLCEKMIHLSVKALTERDVRHLDEVFEAENQVNQLHLEIDDRCVKLFALRTPVAVDLRTIMAAMKINSELERIGDQAVNVGQNTQELLQHPATRDVADVSKMAEIAMDMLRGALDAFVKRDTDMAQKVVDRDDEVDALKSRSFGELVGEMVSDPGSIRRCLDLILIARNLERLADHATNIGEDVVFMVKGKDIRHHAGDPHYKPSPKAGPGLH